LHFFLSLGEINVVFSGTFISIQCLAQSDQSVNAF
jgi:hypothetical protein